MASAKTSPPADVQAEARLVERVRGGDPNAFDRLVAGHQKRAFAVAYRLLGHVADAEDVVQEAFLAALEGIDSFETGRPFGPWLHRIVVNRALNARTARSRRDRDRVRLPRNLHTRDPSPEGDLVRRELRRRLEEAMQRLDDRQADLVRLHYLEGFSSGELATTFGIRPGTVRWHLHEARRRLRAALEDGKEQAGRGSGGRPSRAGEGSPRAGGDGTTSGTGGEEER